MDFSFKEPGSLVLMEQPEAGRGWAAGTTWLRWEGGCSGRQVWAMLSLRQQEALLCFVLDLHFPAAQFQHVLWARGFLLFTDRSIFLKLAAVKFGDFKKGRLISGNSKSQVPGPSTHCQADTKAVGKKGFYPLVRLLQSGGFRCSHMGGTYKVSWPLLAAGH